MHKTADSLAVLICLELPRAGLLRENQTPKMTTSQYKVVLLGEGRVGKTSLCLRYCRGTFSSTQESTIAATHLEKTLHIRQQQMRIHIWDTAGQERFHSLGALYYRDAQGAVLVYDVCDQDTFNRVQRWVEELKQMAPPNITLVIVGNKADLPREDWKVATEEAAAFARHRGAHHFHVSAKTGEGVDAAFLEIAKGMMLKKKEPSSRDDNARKIMEDLKRGKDSSDSTGCCSS
eukprot:g57528.t1